MAFQKYLRPINGLPDLKGPLSSSIPSTAIAEANRLVNQTRKEETEKKKCRPYKKYSLSVQLEIAEYTCHHGVASAARVFSHKLQQSISESTVRSIRNAYRQELRKKGRREDNEDEMSIHVHILPTKKRGRRVMLREDIDKKVQLYIKKTRESGVAVSVQSVVAAARGIVLKLNRSSLAELGGPVTLNKHWA